MTPDLSHIPEHDLFDNPPWARVEIAMTRAASRAERLESGWQHDALEALKLYANFHADFLLEDIGIYVPADADRRALGAITTEAKHRGWIKSDGTRRDKWGSHKTRWVSLIYKSREN